MSYGRKGGFALAAAIAGVVVFVGSLLINDPWPGTTNRIIQNGLTVVSIGLGLAALILGAKGWRSDSAKVAVGIVLAFVALCVFVGLTVQGN